MKINKLYISFLLLTIFASISTFAREIRVSSRSGNSRAKLVSAINAARPGDTVLLDQNVTFGANDGAITISRDNITIRGRGRSNGKYAITRPATNRTFLIVTAKVSTITNIEFRGSTAQIIFRPGNATATRVRVNNCVFRNSGYTGIDFSNGRFRNTIIKNCRFFNCPFSIQTFDCPILRDFTIEDCQFTGGDHQISLDNPLARIQDHGNIRISRCRFNRARRFNVALANTRNVLVDNNVMEGGTQAYSQCLHIEDRTRNVIARSNTMRNNADVAVLSFTTDRVGHGGNGRRLTESERVRDGSSNITLDNNTISSGSADAAISVGYGRGFFRIFGNNVITSGNRGVDAFRAVNTNFEINDNARIKGKRYRDIRNDRNVMRRESYVRIRR